MPDTTTNWLQTYMEYTAEAETPPRFDWWAGLSVLSAAVGRRVWAQVAPNHDPNAWLVHPNLYLFLVGTSGCGKSDAIKYARAIVTAHEDIPLAPDGTTRAAFIDCLEENAGQMFVLDPEIATFLYGSSMGKAKADPDWIVFLCKLYDLLPEHEYRTRSGGKVVIPEPYVTICGGITLETLTEVLPATTIGAGFASRTLLVVEDEYTRELDPNTRLNTAKRNKLVYHLERIHKFHGVVTFEVAATTTYTEWKDRFLAARAHRDEISVRIPSQVVRVAMLVALGNLSMTVCAAHVAEAIRRVEDVLPGTRRVFARTQANKHAWIMDELEDRIQRNGPMLRAKFMYDFRFFGTESQLSAVLKHAQSAHRLIQRNPDGTGAMIYLHPEVVKYDTATTHQPVADTVSTSPESEPVAVSALAEDVEPAAVAYVSDHDS